MLRFLPDGWLDTVLRPFLLADPVASLYVEIAAPDIRFAGLIVLLLLAWMARRGRTLLPHQALTLFGMAVSFYTWTVISGNGRYFIWGLLLVGPLMVMLARRLPATQFIRNSVVLGLLGLQAVAISMSFSPNMWSVRDWKGAGGLSLEPTPLKNRPAIFLTLGALSYSALVPQMHPGSRWANITGQLDILPGEIEYPALQAMLQSFLPMYAVVHATDLLMGTNWQPIPKAMGSVRGILARHQLALNAPTCEYVRTSDTALRLMQTGTEPTEEGFWFCPVRLLATTKPTDRPEPVAPELNDVFTLVERRCPRFFPPGSERSRQIDGAVKRYYSYSDTNLYVDNFGSVYFKNNRALNPTPIATVEQIRRGVFDIDCHRMPGRYLPPWARD